MYVHKSIIIDVTILSILHVVTPCESRIPLLNYDYGNPHLNSVSYGQISATSDNYSPSHATMSGDGWCGDNQDVCTVMDSPSQYLQVNFGAEMVVEAVAIAKRYYHYVTKYYVKYGSNTSHFYYAISDDSSKNVSYKLVILATYAKLISPFK